MFYNRKNCVPHINKIDIKETVKVAEITDPYGNLRYKVALTSYDIIDDGKTRLVYKNQVVNHFGVPAPLIIVETEPTYDYNFAITQYCDYVKSYSNLVKAETKDLQDMDIYSENVGYEKTKPKCCATCKWVRKRCTKNDFIYDVTGKLECTNPKNCKAYQQNMFEAHTMHRLAYDMKYGHRICFDEFSHNVLYPTVDKFGFCENYLEAIRDQVPIPGQSITEFIDIKLANRIDHRISAVVDSILSDYQPDISDISNEISTTVTTLIDSKISNVVAEDILPMVGDAIEHQLSTNPPILIGGDKALSDLMSDVNGDGTIDNNDFISFDGGGA